MARFEIKSKDGLSVRFFGKPVYNGSYLKPSSLTFSEVNSPTPIAWEVGDYVDYTRTGMRYYLYSIPQPTKRAKMGSRGDAFSYSGVQFFAATKELEIALFKDLVNSDNNIHFSTSPDVATFENVEGIARRIQSCMDYFFPNRWEIRIADFDAVEDAEIIEKINTAKDFALSNGTCLDALSRIYELWQDIGWIHTNENGKEVIIIGYPNKRISENTTDAFVYGKGNGLTAIKKNQTNKDEFATRLYVYGSERNLPARYYNDKDILNAESVDIRNLMLPLDKWGLTDGKPDARKAYLENAEAVAKYGLIPKTHYFDSEEAGADIYPTISGMTIGKIREALTALGQTDSAYFPSAELYPDASQRVDKVRWCDNPDDHGDVGDVLLNGSPSMFDGETKSVDVSSGTRTANIVENKLMASAEFSYSESRTCKVRFSTAVSGYVNDDGFESVVVKMRLSDSNNANSSMSKVVEYPAVLNGDKWEFTLPSVEYDYGQIPKTIFGAYAFLTIAVTLPSGSKDKSISYVLNTGIQHLDLYLIMEKTFLLRLHEIGFDIDKQASLGKGKVISMKTGACAGRSFVIESCRHKGGIYTQGYWDLTLKRQKDNTLGLMFPNVNAQIVEGDEFVLTDIAMPELYVQAAMLRLLSDGQELLTRASSIQNLYEPSIDAKVMVEQGRTLREGMFMEISDADVVDNTTEYILIDTLSIHEDESAIPTYKVTLKERRKVTYKGTPSATSADNTESVEDDVQTEVNIDLSEYAKKAEVEEVSELLSTMWQLEGDTIVATKDVRIKANLIVEQDTSSGGEGQDTPGAGLDEDEVLDIVKGYTYSKSEINKLIDDVNAGDVDLTNYYTKDEVDAKIPSLDGYATENYVDDAITALNVGQYAKASDLATILSGINADIAKNAENIVALDKDKADKATTLAGYGITDAYTKSDLESYKTWWDAVMGLVVKDGNNIRIKTNLIIEGDTSSGGSGQDTPASGTVTGIKVSASETLTPNNAGIIDMVSVLSSIDVSDQLKEYAKLTDITKSRIDSVLGSTTAGNANRFLMSTGSTSVWASISKTNVTDALGYTPLSTGGGTIEGSLQIGKDDNTAYNYLRLVRDGYEMYVNCNAYGGYISYGSIGASTAQLRLLSDGITFNGNTLIHSGNYSSYALPKSGGMIESTNTNTPLSINGGGDWVGIGYFSNSSKLGYLGIWNDYRPIFIDASWNVYNLIHSGNIGSYNAGSADRLATFYSENINYGSYITDLRLIHTTDGNGVSNGFPGDYFSGLSVLAGYTGWQMVTYGDTAYPNPHFRSIGGGGNWSPWRQLAFLTDNVASATKLQTARTIWGQSFDGTSNVDGKIYQDGRWIIGLHSDNNLYVGYDSKSIGNTLLFGKELQFYDGIGNCTMLINSSGNVTIGSSDLAGTSTKLYVDGILYNKGDVRIPNGVAFQSYLANGTLVNLMYLNASDILTIGTTSSRNIELIGNVGIGTPSPAYKLDVIGDISAMSALRIGGCGTTYCGLYPNSQITSGGNATRLWLYNEGGLAFYGTSLEIMTSTSINGNLVVSGDIAAA